MVLLLPGIDLPPNTAASVYISIPTNSGAAPNSDFKFLGGIGPGKESAIFKISGLHGDATNGAEVNMDAPSAGDIVLGISVESGEEVSAKMAALQSANSYNNNNSTSSDANAAGTMILAGRRPPPTTTVVLAQRIIKNAFNFLASFAGNVPVPGGSGTAGVEVVPLKAFSDWWLKFENKVKNDPSFLEKDVD